MLPKQEQKTARILAAMAAELRGDRPVVIGPWTGEVGYETLYWIPFVRWALERFHVAPARVIVVSRGGVSSWYGRIPMARYVDAFDLMSPDEVRSLAADSKPKQYAFDDPGGDELMKRVEEACGLDGAARLLPHWMYRLYSPYFKNNAGLDLLEQHAVWTRFAPPAPDRVAAVLPPRYLALRFYFSQSLPDVEANRRFAGAMIERLAADVPVVLLNQPFTMDEHRDYLPGGGATTSVAGLMSPSDNLAIQTAVIGGAAAFVGTYGGLSLIPPLCGVPSFAFYSAPFMKPTHEQAIRRMIARTSGAPLRVAEAADGTAQAQAVLDWLEAPQQSGVTEPLRRPLQVSRDR